MIAPLSHFVNYHLFRAGYVFATERIVFYRFLRMLSSPQFSHNHLFFTVILRYCSDSYTFRPYKYIYFSRADNFFLITEEGMVSTIPSSKVSTILTQAEITLIILFL